MLKGNYRFIIRFLGFTLVLVGIYELMDYLNELNNWYRSDVFTYGSAIQTLAFLRLFDHFHMEYFDGVMKGFEIYLNETPLVSVVPECNGFLLMVLFLGFLYARETGLKNNFYFALAGIFLINGLNVLRIAGLTFVVLNDDSMFYKVKPIFNGVLYLVVFTLWYVHLRYYSVKEDKLDSPNQI